MHEEVVVRLTLCHLQRCRHTAGARFCGELADMKGGWAASPGNTAPVNPPALLALQPLLTQASTPVQTVQQSTTTAAQPKQDTSMAPRSLAIFRGVVNLRRALVGDNERSRPVELDREEFSGYGKCLNSKM
ncbi:hypothetical protein GEV33_007066 [Tenebrio molitor]|uniref:Uncharacterized protein n=1 Tax=Tenebrio molitor TaxID=7067 RepID=A0A8J6LBG2_TENMO|nr:hypothetical protein GEV33_007066 [Tenebrio molitor]